MWKIHRYYLKEVAVNALLAFVVLFAVVLISLVAKGIQKAQGGDLMDAAKITLYWALDSFPHLLTISFLLATVLTFARASQDREITAIRSAGISPRVPMTACLIVGIALSVVGSLAMHYAIPKAHYRKYRVVAEAIRNVVLNLNLTSDRITVPETGIVMTFRDRDRSRNFLDCTLYLPDDMLRLGGLPSPIVNVERISIPVDEESEFLDIHLQGVRDPLSGNRLGALELRLPLRDITEKNRRDESDKDLASDQLLSEVARGVHPAPTGARYTVQRRSCFALMPALLAPIGFCIGVLARNRGRVTAMVFAMVPLLLFYAADVLGAKLLRLTDMSLFGWLPAVVLLVLGVPFCWRLLRL